MHRAVADPKTQIPHLKVFIRSLTSKSHPATISSKSENSSTQMLTRAGIRSHQMCWHLASELIKCLHVLASEPVHWYNYSHARTQALTHIHAQVTRGLPDPDILIRTSGEYRLSNYLLFEYAQSTTNQLHTDRHTHAHTPTRPCTYTKWQRNKRQS